jgi:hypothetical protein
LCKINSLLLLLKYLNIFLLIIKEMRWPSSDSADRGRIIIRVSSTHANLYIKYISTLKYCEYMCPGFAWSECMNYFLECNAKLYVLVTVWEMIIWMPSKSKIPVTSFQLGISFLYRTNESKQDNVWILLSVAFIWKYVRKYVVNQKLKQFDNISYRELLGESVVLFYIIRFVTS